MHPIKVLYFDVYWIPQPWGSFSGHKGTGHPAPLPLKARTVFLECAVDTAPVRARAMTKMRTIVFFILILSWGMKQNFSQRSFADRATLKPANC
jgi:hypothetical protein